MDNLNRMMTLTLLFGLIYALCKYQERMADDDITDDIIEQPYDNDDIPPINNLVDAIPDLSELGNDSISSFNELDSYAPSSNNSLDSLSFLDG
jgi:hypothetical protein